MDGVDFVPTQRATQALVHGKLIWETDNSNVLRIRKAPHDPKAGPEPPPIVDFVGQGVATYTIKMIYQPNQESFPCLVSNPRFRFRVSWDDNSEAYLATPIDSGEMNQSADWLDEGVRTMNALHDYWQSQATGSDGVASPSDHSSAPLPNKIAEVVGSFVGAAGRVYFG